MVPDAILLSFYRVGIGLQMLPLATCFVVIFDLLVPNARMDLFFALHCWCIFCIEGHPFNAAARHIAQEAKELMKALLSGQLKMPSRSSLLGMLLIHIDPAIFVDQL